LVFGDTQEDGREAVAVEHLLDAIGGVGDGDQTLQRVAHGLGLGAGPG
jgi:hypothetical protein